MANRYWAATCPPQAVREQLVASARTGALLLVESINRVGRTEGFFLDDRAMAKLSALFDQTCTVLRESTMYCKKRPSKTDKAFAEFLGALTNAQGDRHGIR